MRTLQQQLQQAVLDHLNDNNVSQAFLARDVGISAKHLNEMLSGAAGGTLQMWERLAESLGCEWNVDLYWGSP